MTTNKKNSSIQKTKKKIFALLAKRPKTAIFLTIILIITVLISKYSNFNGYCFEEKRYLSKEELIDRYVRTGLPSDKKGIKKRIAEYEVIEKREGKKYFYYKSQEHFLELNPDCCRIVDGTPLYDGAGDFQHFIFKLFGKHYHGTVKYARLATPNDEEKYYKRYSVIDSCGKILRGSDTGIDVSKETYKAYTEIIKERKIRNKLQKN